MQVFILHDAQVFNNIRIELVVMKAAIVFQVVRVAIDVYIIEQLIILNFSLVAVWLVLGRLQQTTLGQLKVVFLFLY